MALYCDGHFHSSYSSFINKPKLKYVSKCVLKKFIDRNHDYDFSFPSTDIYNLRDNQDAKLLYLKTRLCSLWDFRVYFLVTKNTNDLYLSRLHPKENKGGFSNYTKEAIKSNLAELKFDIKNKKGIYKITTCSKNKKLIFTEQ
jgi:hypothetical protein